MKKRIWISFFVILGIFFLIGVILDDIVIAEGENDFSYIYDYYNIEGAFEYSRQGSLLYPYGFGSYNLRGYPMQNYVLANYSSNPYSLGSYLYRYIGGGYPMQSYVLANYSPNAYSLGSYLYRNIGGGYPMQNYVLANYGFGGFGGFY
ncbi:MAG: hypothetical protein ACMUHX_10235 [bacterium]